MNMGSVILFVKDMRTVTAFDRDIVGLLPDAEQLFSGTASSVLTPGSASSTCTAQARRKARDKRLAFTSKA